VTDSSPPLVSEEGPPARSSAWRHPGFRQLARAWVFTNLADSALFLMAAVWVKELTGSDGAAAMVFVVIGLPALLAPFIGQIADRTSRKRMLVIANLAMVPVLMALFAVTDAGSLWILYAVVFLYGVMQFLTGSAGSGLIRDLLPDEDLASGNGVLQTIDQGLRLVSPLIGTALYVAFGPRSVVLLTVVCFAITGYLLSRLAVDESPAAVRDSGSTYWQEITAGFRHLFRTPVLGPLTVVLTVAFGVIGLVNAAVFPVMEQGLGLEPAMLGVFVSLQGVGAVAGGLTSAATIRRLTEKGAIGTGTLLIGVGLIPFIGTSLSLALAGMIVLGVGVPWVIVGYVTLRQRLTPAQLQGRTAAASNVALNFPQTVALMAAAAVIDLIDYRILIVTAATMTMACALAVARTKQPVSG
jgi:MFS family permease